MAEGWRRSGGRLSRGVATEEILVGSPGCRQVIVRRLGKLTGIERVLRNVVAPLVTVRLNGEMFVAAR